jgi:hypothetical protein
MIDCPSNYNYTLKESKKMKTQEIEKFLNNEFKKIKPNTRKFPQAVKDYIINYADKHNWTGDINLIFLYNLIKDGVTEFPDCALDGCTEKVKIGWDGKLTKGCCKGHTIKATNLERHGVTCTQQIKEIKEKTNNTMIDRYGVKHAFQNKELKAKAEETMMERFGAKNASNVKSLREKAEDTMLKNYGVTVPLKSEEIKSRATIKQIENGGFGFQRPKGIKTLIEKYGVTNPSQVPEFFEKAKESAFQRKEYIWKSGDISYVQGYENIILAELEENGYSFKDVLTSPKDMPEIFYDFEGKQSRYYPDIYIPSDNLIIEVKSEYTLNKDLKRNEEKFKATKNAGFEFILEVR